jgi:CRP-like cAMP-binding protein
MSAVLSQPPADATEEIPLATSPTYIGRMAKTYQTGDVLFQEGDMGREMFIVLSGEIAIHKNAGDQQVHLGTFKPGDFFGEMALVESGVRTGTATATQPHTEVVPVNQSRFVYLVSQQPAFALSVMRMMGRRVEEMNQRLTELSGQRQLGAI